MAHGIVRQALIHAAAALIVVLGAGRTTASTITTIAGGGIGDGGAAATAELRGPSGVAADAAGNVYIADTLNHRVRRVSPSGSVTTIAGTGEEGFSGDGGPATTARLRTPIGVAVDAKGDLYIADAGNHRIRRVTFPAGIIATVAGTGTRGFSGDGRLATAAQLNAPTGVSVDVEGNLFIADRDNARVRKVAADTRTITTVAGAGQGGFTGDDYPATSTWLRFPTGVAVDSRGNLFVADMTDHRIRRVDLATGRIATVAGTGQAGVSGDDGAAARAQLNSPAGVAVDRFGNLLIADTKNNRVLRMETATGVLTTVAGAGQGRASGGGGPAASARILLPSAVAGDSRGNVLIVETGSHQVRRVEAATGDIVTVAGAEATGVREGAALGDDGPASLARLHSPSCVTLDDRGSLFIADTGNHRIRRVDLAARIITTIAGREAGFAGDGSQAVVARLRGPTGLAVDGQGNLFVADTGNHRVRKIDKLTGIITNVAGTGIKGFAGDGQPAVHASLDSPSGLAVDRRGFLFLADTGNHRIRRINLATGTITTVAGRQAGFAGDGEIATAAELESPTGIAIDEQGNLFVADTANHRIRRIDRVTNVITTVAGMGMFGFYGENEPATTALLHFPRGVVVDSRGNLLIADAMSNRIRAVMAATGMIVTVAGSGPTEEDHGTGFSGDGDIPTRARLRLPTSVAVDGDGTIYIADLRNHRIRKISYRASFAPFRSP